MTLDSSCPVVVAQDLLAALVALADGDPARVLRVYASRLCFYCDSQSDPSLRDQVAEVGGMMRALEHFTRALFKGGEGDLCVQFLYKDLSSSDLGKSSFSHTLSEEELNDLLCGRKEYPHVAKMINGCLASRLSSIRRFAYETLANVAVFAKAHRHDAVETSRRSEGPKAFEMLLRTRLRGLESDPRLVAVLAALVWALERVQQNLPRRHVIARDVTAQEIVFVDEELQDERLVGSGAPGSYSLLDDLFAESGDVRLVALHSVSRILFHSWIPTGTALSESNGCLHSEEDEKGECSDQDDRKLLPGATSSRDDALPSRNPTTVAACAEQAVAQLALALQDSTRGPDSRLRLAARRVEAWMQSRKAPSWRGLLARSALVLVDHGLANGSLDGVRDCFCCPTQDGGGGNPAGLNSIDDAVSTSSGDENELKGNGVGTTLMRGVGSLEDTSTGVSKSAAKKNPDQAARRYAAAVHFLVTMLSREDQESVTVAVESRLVEYFDDGDAFWGCGWALEATTDGWSDDSGDAGASRRFDAGAAVAWLMAGTGIPRGSCLGGVL